MGTIHTFQGREKEAIILDTIMTAEIQNKRRDYSVRPFDETKNGMAVPRLLNVACTRSKKLLVIIADMNHMKKVYRGKFMARFLNGNFFVKNDLLKRCRALYLSTFYGRFGGNSSVVEHNLAKVGVASSNLGSFKGNRNKTDCLFSLKLSCDR